MTMHSKQPQAVIGFSIIEYMVTSWTTPWEPSLFGKVVRPNPIPFGLSIDRPVLCLIGWFGPVGIDAQSLPCSRASYRLHKDPPAEG